MCCAFFMCRKTTSGSNKAVSPPLRKSLRPCAPVTLHARFVSSFVKITPPDENLRAYIINYKSAPFPFVNELMKKNLFLLRARLV